MEPSARRWFDTHTHAASDFAIEDLLVRKRDRDMTVSVVIPARDEAATVRSVVSRIADSLVSVGLVDELVVIDSDSSDDTAGEARAGGAIVHAAAGIPTGLDPVPGKGEALWRSQFVTRGDILVFIDADLTEWGPHFVIGLLGPILADEPALLVKGFYDRLFVSPDGQAVTAQGGRVTELVARPLLNLYWPALAGVVQPLAGEWAITRSLAQTLPFPVGYGVEFATLTDTAWLHGLDSVAQVDLGRRGHVHQNVHDLGVMATEILATATRRLNRDLPPGSQALAKAAKADAADAVWVDLQQYDRTADGFWRGRPVPVAERPPAITLDSYRTSC
jgi:glucosyl-3-phosphoglycerate synthase